MSTARVGHSATLLRDGTVLVVGGWDTWPTGAPPTPLAYDSTEIFDPKTRAWHAGPSTHSPHAGHGAVLLADGRVFVADVAPEIYDPAARTWTDAAAFAPTSRVVWGGATATLLASGRVLVVGAFDSISAPKPERIYDPNGDAWSDASMMALPRMWHASIRLPSGKVLVAGGDTSPRDGVDRFTTQAEVYDETTNTWTSTARTTGRYMWAFMTLLSDGRAVIAGGLEGANAAEAFDEKTGAWTLLPPIAAGRQVLHPYTLAGDRILVRADKASSPELQQMVELLTPGAAAWTTIGKIERSHSTDVVLSDGTLLVTGGEDAAGVTSSTAMLVAVP
jgi:hypothetical protein